VHLIQLINAFFSLFFLFIFEEDILQNFVHFFCEMGFLAEKF